MEKEEYQLPLVRVDLEKEEYQLPLVRVDLEKEEYQLPLVRVDLEKEEYQLPLVRVDLEKEEYQLPLVRVDLGSAAAYMLKKSSLTNDVKNKFRIECVVLLVNMLKKIKERSPLKHLCP